MDKNALNQVPPSGCAACPDAAFVPFVLYAAGREIQLFEDREEKERAETKKSPLGRNLRNLASHASLLETYP